MYTCSTTRTIYPCSLVPRSFPSIQKLEWPVGEATTYTTYLDIQYIVVWHKDDIGLRLELPGQVVRTHPPSGTREHEVFNVQNLSSCRLEMLNCTETYKERYPTTKLHFYCTCIHIYTELLQHCIHAYTCSSHDMKRDGIWYMLWCHLHATPTFKGSAWGWRYC